MGSWQKQVGDGRERIFFSLYSTGHGLQVMLFGGEQPHVGGVVLALPRASLENPKKASGDYYLLPVPGHKDTVLGELVGKILVEAFQVPIVVTAGVHSDHATPEELDQIIKVCGQLAREAVSALRLQEK